MTGDSDGFSIEPVEAPEDGSHTGNRITPGWVFWITGLSGAGKSMIGRMLYDQLRALHANSAFLDGNTLREVLGNEYGYSLADRKKCTQCYSRLCRLLSNQGVHVVLATISMFHDCRRWNREHLARYYEVYLRVPMSVLAERDPRGIYRPEHSDESGQVWGVDLVYEEPANPDLVIDNDGVQTTTEIAHLIWNKVSRLSF